LEYGHSNKQGYLMRYKIINLALICSIITACGENSIIPAVENVGSDITVCQFSDTSGVERKLRKVWFYADSQSFDQRAQTSLYVANQVLQTEDIDYVEAFHLPYVGKDTSSCILAGQAIHIGSAFISNDGVGRNGKAPLKNSSWEAQAFRGNVNEGDTLVAMLWISKRGDYQVSEHIGTGYHTDGKALKEEISRMIKNTVAAEKIGLTYYPMEDYLIYTDNN